MPLLLKPLFLSLRNRWGRGFDLRHQTGRDLILLVFSLFLVAGLYRGTMWALRKVNEDPNLVYLPPAQPLGLVLLVLMTMLTISGIVTAYATLFQSDDLDLLLAAPTTSFRLFCGKFAMVLIHSAWMPLMLLVPILIGFAHAYAAPSSFYLMGTLTLIPYFFIPPALSIVIATLLTCIIPGNRTREIIAAVFVILGVTVYFLFYMVREAWQQVQDAGQLLHIISLLSTPKTAWLPSNWGATTLQEWMRPTDEGALPYLVLLFMVALTLTSLAYIAVELLHFRAYSRTKTEQRARRRQSKLLQAMFDKWLPFLNPQFRAVLLKEFKLFSREITQAIQLLMLVGLCAVYIYNLKVFASVQSFAGDSRLWYQRFLFIGNFTIGAFVATAVCTRFAFPSLSLEGRCYWILQNAPMPLRDVMRAKFWCWFLPVAIVSCLLFSVGALAVGTTPLVIGLYAASSICIAYGVVGAALGFGALYVNFTWEHASQLAAGFGSLMYMLFSTLLIGITMVPTWMMLFAYPQLIFEGRVPDERGMLWVIANLFAIWAVNYLAGQWAMREGVKALGRGS